MDKVLESLYATMVVKNGVLYCKYKTDMFIDLEAAKIVVEQRKQATGYTTTPILVDATQVVKMNKEARNHFASLEGSELISAAAILVESKVSTFLANFLIKVNLQKTNMPLRLFTSEQEALEWLLKYK
jgi:hypothetical protein